MVDNESMTTEERVIKHTVAKRGRKIAEYLRTIQRIILSK